MQNYTVMKRFFDLCVALVGTLLVSPILLLVAIGIWLDDRGPIFFRQERIGWKGKPFRIWKFRTMAVGSEKGPIFIFEKQPDGKDTPSHTQKFRPGADGAEKQEKPLPVGRDPRVTRIGAVLRKIKFDELPQLFNVLAGEMSLVGPRPEVPHRVQLYTAEQRRVLDMMPGITSPASIKYRDEGELLAQVDDPERTYRDVIMPEKIRLNLEYAERASVSADVAIVWRTLGKLFR